MPRILFLWLLCSILATLSAACPTVSLQLGNCTVQGTSIDSWGFMFTLASPSQSQSVCIVPSTVVNGTLLLGSGFCQNYTNGTTAQCESLSGGTFNTAAAEPSYIPSPSSILAADPVWDEISPQITDAGFDSVQLTADYSIPKYPVGIITSGIEQNVGHLGLAAESQFLHDAHDNGLIAQIGFGLNAGSQSVANPRPGGIVLGGYDQACIGGPFSNYTVVDVSSSERQCPLQVTISQLAIRYPLAVGFTDHVLSSDGIDIPACIEPYDNLFRLPQTLLQAFQTNTGWSANTKADSNLLIVEPGLYYELANSFNGSLVFTLSDGRVVVVPNEEMTNPLRGIDTNGARVLDTNISVVSIFHQEAPLNTAVLGKIFLSQEYLTVDYESGVFHLAQMASSPPTFPANPVSFNATPIACSNSHTSGLSKGAKIGLGVGLGIGACLLLAGLALWAWIKARRQHTTFWAALLGILTCCLPKRRNEFHSQGIGMDKTRATNANDPPHLKTHSQVIG